jgi:ketosteroid isomerase-like protein
MTLLECCSRYCLGPHMPLPLVIAAVFAAAAPDPIAASIVASENMFAADAQRFGVRLAFLAHFDADSWVLRPYPVPALAALARDADDGSRLEWAPEIAGVAASGDMGFTSGAWTAHAPGTDKSVHGHFLTVWKRGEDGIWRVQVDGGVSHPALEQSAGGVKTLEIATKDHATPSADALASRRKALEAADDTLRDALGRAQGDTTSIWRDVADTEFRALRSRQQPADGDAAWALVATNPARRGSGTRRAYDVASSGDFAYTIGGEAACKECGSYYRIWRWRDDRWRLFIDLETP